MSSASQSTYHVKITIMDYKLEPEMAHLSQDMVDIELRLGNRSLCKQDMANIAKTTTKVPLSPQISNEHIQFICTGDGLDENIGSVSIPQFIVLNGGLNTYNQWITLFEHEEDDEYDGEMGINDDEEPMIKIQFEICQDEPAQPAMAKQTSKQSSSATAVSGGVKTTTVTTTTTTTSQMRNGVQTSSSSQKHSSVSQSNVGNQRYGSKNASSALEGRFSPDKSRPTTGNTASVSGSKSNQFSAGKSSQKTGGRLASASGADKYRSPDSSNRAGVSAGKRGVATGSSNKQVGAKSASSALKSASKVADQPSLEEELQENPDLVYDPMQIRKMLILKIGKLGETIRSVQANNFGIEDDVLEKLRLLKGFNDKLQSVSAQSAMQAKSLKENFTRSQKEKAKIVTDKTQVNDKLFNTLLDNEHQLNSLRIKADLDTQTANGLTVRNVEELTIDLNRVSNVDKQPLTDLKTKKAELMGQSVTTEESVRYQVGHIRSEAEFLQGKVSEYEALLLSYADEKSYLVSEIERLRLELNHETNQSAYQEIKGELLEGRVGILVTANNGMSQLITERKKQGSKVKTEMQESVQDQLNHKVELNTDLDRLQDQELVQLQKDRTDITEDLTRLQELSKRYGLLDRQMQECTQEFNKAQDLRKEHRLQLANIFEQVNENMDENLANEVNFDEVEELCKMIDEKDQALYTDLMKLQDQLNQKKIAQQGFKPDSTTVSSIMINEIETTEIDVLKKEKDDLDMRIKNDQAEIDKVMKITAKYKQSLEKQTSQEANAIEMLNLQEEELRSLHDESRGLATDLNAERKAISKDRQENKIKLQHLYNYDVKMQLIKESIEKRELQLTELQKEKEHFDSRLELARAKLEKTLKQTTTRPKKYRAVKGDSIDEMLANVLNIKNCEIPISRIGEGWYMFGSKKIYTKITNNRLICCVGGGYMNMDEFISQYAESERLKLERMAPEDIEALHSSGGDRHNIRAVPLSQRAGSPKAGMGAGARSPKAAAGSPKMKRQNSGSFKRFQ